MYIHSYRHIYVGLYIIIQSYFQGQLQLRLHKASVLKSNTLYIRHQQFCMAPVDAAAGEDGLRIYIHIYV